MRDSLEDSVDEISKKLKKIEKELNMSETDQKNYEPLPISLSSSEKKEKKVKFVDHNLDYESFRPQKTLEKSLNEIEKKYDEKDYKNYLKRSDEKKKEQELEVINRKKEEELESMRKMNEARMKEIYEEPITFQNRTRFSNSNREEYLLKEIEELRFNIYFKFLNMHSIRY